MQNAQTGIMKKSGMQVNLQNSNIEQPILLVSKYITVYDIISFDTYMWNGGSMLCVQMLKHVSWWFSW